MGLLRFRRRTAAPSNVEFKEFEGKRQPVFTDTQGGQWRVNQTDEGTNALHPLGDQDYEPSFEPALPKIMRGMPTKLPKPDTGPSTRTNLPETINEYFGGFPLPEITRARDEARRGSPLDAYATTADTPELQEQNIMPEKRYHYCTADEPARLLLLKDALTQRLEDHYSGKRPVFKKKYQGDPLETDMTNRLVGALKDGIESVKNMYANHRVINIDNPTFTNTRIVQPGHIVTLSSTGDDGTESIKKYYLLSHPNELIEREHPGIEQVHPHSYLGRSLLMKTRGEAVQPIESHSTDDPTAWSEYGKQQNIYNIETKTLYRQLNSEERESAMKSMSPVEKIGMGTVKDISLPSAAALSGSSNEINNKRRYPAMSLLNRLYEGWYPH